MKNRGRLYGIIYSLFIAFIIAVVLGVAAPAIGGHPVTVLGFLNSLWQGTLVGALVGIILPIPRIDLAGGQDHGLAGLDLHGFSWRSLVC